MGFVRVEVGVSSPARPESEERIEVLIDTRTMLSVIPGDLLERLGVRPELSKKNRGCGGRITREIGGIMMSYDESLAGVTVIFGEKDDPAIMGVTALESLGYQVDPVTGKLSPTEMLLL